jgi:hypothetical protein
MTGSQPKHIRPEDAGTESREAKSAYSGGGMFQPYLSTSQFASANEGSQRKRRPWVWALGWFAGVVGTIAVFILIVR